MSSLRNIVCGVLNSFYLFHQILLKSISMSKRTIDDFFNVANKKKDSHESIEVLSSSGSASTNR